MSDSFAIAFFSELESKFLDELHVSALGLSLKSAPGIAAYLASECCHLHTFKANGNFLRFKGVTRIVAAVESHNFGLTWLELHSNQLVDSETNSDGEVDDEAPPLNFDAWTKIEASTRNVIQRNINLKRVVRKEALDLLRYSRPILTASASSVQPKDDELRAFQDTRALPTELQHHILSYFAPTLSHRQRTRIFTYASFTSTLPSLLPDLRVGMPQDCLHDPTGLHTRNHTLWRLDGTGVRESECSKGNCKGGVSCRRQREQDAWLKALGCLLFDPGDDISDVGAMSVFPIRTEDSWLY